jgi:uncharacterized RDD family membrane protein YckC
MSVAARPPAATEPQVARASPDAGLITRAVAFALDVAIVDGIIFLAGVVIALIVEAFSKFDPSLDAGTVALGAGAWCGTAVVYCVAFWALTGQTPGMRALGIEVRTTSGEPLRPRRSLRRLAGMVLAAIPLFAGYYIPILIRDDRRGLHDLIAGTTVRYAERKRPPRPGRPRV